MKTKLSGIVLNAGTQLRAELNQEVIADYAQCMASGDKFPPVKIVQDDKRLILVDGFHRYHAAIKNKAVTIDAQITKGTRQDAVKFALAANASHGLRRTNADKRNAVAMALKEWPKLSSREIAKLCAVSHNFANDSRNQLSSDDRSPRIGADGKERSMPKSKPAGPEPKVESEADIAASVVVAPAVHSGHIKPKLIKALRKEHAEICQCAPTPTQAFESYLAVINDFEF